MCVTYITLVFVVGLCLGSFINALVWRLSQQLDENGDSKALSKKQRISLSITKGRSMCPSCKHILAWYDLIPVISWISLGGKCRYCEEKISPQYPAIELLTSVLFVVSYLAWPLDPTHKWVIVSFVSWLLLLVGLISLALYDAKYMLLPNRLIYPLVGIAGTSIAIQIILGRPLSSVLAIFGAIIISSGIFWILYHFSEGRWIGGGDIKLGILAGMLLGSATLAFLYLFVASILGLAYSLPLLLTKRLTKASKVPFGPFLIAAIFVVILWGNQLANWYMHVFIGA